VHYPGIELVCDARLSLASDPYLADYRVDGQPVLPPVLALEALAEAASALAGRPLRRATAVTMDLPVMLPAADSGGEILVRVCALADGGKITATLRCAESGLIVDHVRAEFRAVEPAGPGGAASGAQWPGGRAAAGARAAGSRAAGPGMVDGGELYGTVCFQAGRFRRIAGLPELTARSCRALARGPDDRAWFPPARPDAGPGPDGLLLGSPGLNDAVMQALQACVPDRRVWPAACASITFGGAAVVGEVEIRAVAAVRRPAWPSGGPSGGTGGRPSAVPAPALSPDGAGTPQAAELTWDVAAVDSDGRVLVAWQGVRLREAGRLTRAVPWPLALLPAYLESAALRLGLDPDLRITAAAGPPAGRVPQPRLSEPAAAGTAAAGAAAAGAAGVTGRGGAGGAAGLAPPAGPAGGLVLDAGGAPFAACGWALADPRHPVWPTSAAGRAATFSRLCSHLSEPPVASAARLQAAAACLARAGAPADAPVRFERATADGWAILAVSDARLACTVVEVTGLPDPVAIAIMTDSPRPVLRERPVRGGAARRWS
jgi:enediyne polyketide synthase